MSKIIVIIFSFWVSTVFCQTKNAIPVDSTCLKYKRKAIQEYQKYGFVFELIDSNITSRDFFIDSIAKEQYHLIIKRSIKTPLERCGTVQLEMECYFNTRDSIYEKTIGEDYLNRLIENVGLDFDLLNGINIDSVYHSYPDSNIHFNYELIYEAMRNLSNFTDRTSSISIKIKSNTKLTVEDFTYDFKWNSISISNAKEVETIFNNLKTNFKIIESAVHKGEKVNSIYVLTFFVRPKK